MESRCEAFDLTLDRAGDEEAILDNMQSSRDAIRAAVAVANPETMQSAAIEYEYGGNDVFTRGLDELSRALPYIYGTRRTLGRFDLQTGEDRVESWCPSEVEQTAIEGGFLESRRIAVMTNGVSTRDLRVYRFATEQRTEAAALVLVEETPNGPEVRLPDAEAPRVFREYPLRSSGFVPVNFIVDGKFDPEQERGGLLMNDGDKRVLEEALMAGVAAVRYAIEQGWRKAHLLAHATRPEAGFEAGNAEETQWWTETLRGFAQGLAGTPIVECEAEMLPAFVEHGRHANFVVPRLLEVSREAETSVERLWPLVAAAKRLVPPKRELAADWIAIVEGWHTLGAKVELTWISKLAECVRGDAKTLEQIGVIGEAKQWLSVFLDVVGECWSNRAGVDLSALEGMVPNQNLRLCSPTELKRDAGVSEPLKRICAGIGDDVRERLLLDGLDKAIDGDELHHAAMTLTTAIPQEVNEEDVVAATVERLGSMLPEGKDCDDVGAEVKQATALLLGHLWESLGEAASPVARRLPLVTASHRGARWSQSRVLMVPVCAWRECAQPFFKAYPPDRVLSELYAGSAAEGIPSVTMPLVRWGMAHADPIIENTVDLRERRLGRLSANGDTAGVTVRDQRLSQIALLTPDVLNRCEESEEHARALLGLVLCCVARYDPAWKEQRVVKGTRLGEEVAVSIRSALWLADLKVRAWVPVPGEDGRPQKMVANAATLRHLLDPAWLKDNDDAIKLLSEWFDFDQLELRLLGIAQDEQDRQELRNSLAELVESGGGDPQFYKELADEVEARGRRKRDVERCRRLGLAVQEAVGAALRRRNLEVKLVDRGFDYEVAVRSDDVYHDTGTAFELGPYLVEVKATTTGHARLTPTQAGTSARERDRYVLCVVDLRQVNVDVEVNWSADRVEALAKLVPDIGGIVGETYDWVELATTLDVSIRNESALRYEVPPDIWDLGIRIEDWVGRIVANLS